MRWLVTGGAGFIGSCFVRHAVQQRWAREIVVLDALTYAGNEKNLAPIAHLPGWRLCPGDIRRPADVAQAMGEGVDAIVHFAAESHVDRSIASASAFVETNVAGTQVLLDAARQAGRVRFVHVSTDEVYGSLALDAPQRFVESTPLAPTSPYAASKAASDLMVLAAARTHGQDALVTRCSNNYGPYQHPEKFIPLFITNALQQKPLPLYGDGKNVRDWVHVDDHVHGVWLALQRGQKGAVYNLGGHCERPNWSIAQSILRLTGASPTLLRPVGDRLAHDRRYAVDTTHAQQALGFVPGPPIEERLAALVQWYKAHPTHWAQSDPDARGGAPERRHVAPPAPASPSSPWH